MKIGDKVICYNIYNDKNDSINFYKSNVIFVIGEKYTITNIKQDDTTFLALTLEKKVLEYITLDDKGSFPVRKHGCPKRTNTGTPIAYFDKFFITEKEYRKRKLKKLNKI